MKIGIIGSGTVATTLAKGFAAHGHEVMLGSRDPAKLDKVATEAPAVRIGTMQQAAAFAELAILAVKGTAAQAALASTADALGGKPVIDTTNPIDEAGPEHGVIRFFTGPNDSLGERLQAAHPQLRLVKAFNSVGAPFMIDPQFPGGRPTMFIAGDDDAAKAKVTALLAEVGWDTADMGAIQASRAIEPLCQLWCLPGFLRNEWRHAFKLLQV